MREDTNFLYLNLYDSSGECLDQIYYDINTGKFERGDVWDN